MNYPLKNRCDRIALYDRGAALTVGLGLLAVCALWGMMAWSTGPTEVRTTENYRQMAVYYAAGQQAFYAAEAGAEAARARLRTVPGVMNPLDPEPHQPDWHLVIEEPRDAAAPRPAEVSYDTAATGPQALMYHVTVRQALDPGASTVLRWGDLRGEGLQVRNTLYGEPLYVITSQGRQGDAQRTVEIEAAPEPPPTVPAALYVAGPLQIQNQRAYVSGLDSCGTQHQPGVRTPLATLAAVSRDGQETDTASVTEGNTIITGSPAVAYHSTPVHVQSMMARFKERADVVYTPDSVASPQTAATARWGSPQPGSTFQAPSSCVERHIIAYKPQHGPAYLAQGTTGCGVLVVEGDLVLQGDFAWYGAILVTGTVHLTGGGRKHITGGMVVAGGMHLDDAGETNLVYCSAAIAEQTRYLPLRVLSWREVALASH